MPQYRFCFSSHCYCTTSKHPDSSTKQGLHPTLQKITINTINECVRHSPPTSTYREIKLAITETTLSSMGVKTAATASRAVAPCPSTRLAGAVPAPIHPQGHGWGTEHLARDSMSMNDKSLQRLSLFLAQFPLSSLTPLICKQSFKNVMSIPICLERCSLIYFWAVFSQ